jgi:hypothetical protein
LIDKLAADLQECMKYKDSPERRKMVENNFRRLSIYINMLSSSANLAPPGPWIKAMNIENFDAETEKEARMYLGSLKRKFISLRNQMLSRKEAVVDSLIKMIGTNGLTNLRDNYENEKLNFIILDEDNTKLTIEKGDRIIQKYKPGHMKATSKYGRAHFYAPVKSLGSLEIDTYWFNVIVLWIISLGLFAALYFELLKKAINYFERIRFFRFPGLK